MVRTQIQLPDELHDRAKRFAAAREMSIAELVRRSLEVFFDQHPEPKDVERHWTLPVLDLGGLKVPVEDLRGVVADEETGRGLRRGNA